MRFSQPVFTAYEGTLAQVCVTLSSGELGTDVNFSIEADTDQSSGEYFV